MPYRFTLHRRRLSVLCALMIASLLAACGGGAGEQAVPDDAGADTAAPQDTGVGDAQGQRTAAEAGAEDCSEHFAGETVTLTVGYGVGGFNDYARMLAPFLRDELGASEVIVENQEGAGGNIQVNNLFAADADELTLGLINAPGAVGSQLTEQPGVRFNMDDFSWVGRIAYEPNIVVVASDGALDSFDDLMAQDPPTFGSEGPGGTNYLLPSLFREVFPEMSELEIITGFDAPEIELAIQRGEIDAMTGPWDSRLAQIEAGEQQAVLVVSGEPIGDKHEAFEGVPAIMDLEQLSDEGRDTMQAFLNFAELGRALAAPPGVDDSRLTCLRDAFERAATSEELIAEGEARSRPIGFLPGEEVDQLVDELVNNLPEEYLNILRDSMSTS